MCMDINGKVIEANMYGIAFIHSESNNITANTKAFNIDLDKRSHFQKPCLTMAKKRSHTKLVCFDCVRAYVLLRYITYAGIPLYSKALPFHSPLLLLLSLIFPSSIFS